MDKHIIHCKGGGKVVIHGDRVEIHLPGPLVLDRKQWVRYLTPADEVQRTLPLSGWRVPNEMLEEAFAAVPMAIHEDHE